MNQKMLLSVATLALLFVGCSSSGDVGSAANQTAGNGLADQTDVANSGSPAVGGNDGSGAVSSGEKYCKVDFTSSTITVRQNYHGNTYSVDGQASGGRIYYSYKESYVSASDAASNCQRLKDDTWYTGVVCQGNEITYSDYDESSVEDAVADWRNMCDQFAILE